MFIDLSSPLFSMLVYVLAPSSKSLYQFILSLSKSTLQLVIDYIKQSVAILVLSLLHNLCSITFSKLLHFTFFFISLNVIFHFILSVNGFQMFQSDILRSKKLFWKKAYNLQTESSRSGLDGIAVVFDDIRPDKSANSVSLTYTTLTRASRQADVFARQRN